MSIHNRHKIIEPFVLLSISLLIYVISHNHGFFWNNVLFGTKMGNVLYENGLFNWTMPDSFDPGHPPFLGMILAAGWKMLGRELWVSHLIMLPFVFGFLYQLNLFITYFFKKPVTRWTAMLLVIADPSLFTQLVLINPEIIQLFALFLSLNGMLQNKRWMKIAGLALLGIITFRGMMLCAGVFFMDVFYQLISQKKKLKQIASLHLIADYTLGALPAISFVVWRLVTKGWLQTHPDSPWADLWYFAPPKTIFRNIVVLAQRYFDFGRIFIFLFILFAIPKKYSAFKNKDVQYFTILAVFSCIILIAVSIFSTNTMGHRYFIPSYIGFILLAFSLLRYFKRKNLIAIALFIGLITGNLWIYPRNFDQGWGASMAHYPYWELRNEAIAYLDDNNISIDETASFFPHNTKIDNVVLNGDMRSFINLTGNEQYVLYSTVFNLTDAQYEILDNKYHPIKIFSKNRIDIIIYQRNS